MNILPSGNKAQSSSEIIWSPDIHSFIQLSERHLVIFQGSLDVLSAYASPSKTTLFENRD